MENSNQPITPYVFADKITIGLTKREYFAGLAMEGLISKSASQMQINTENLIHKSLEIADELLKQLEKTK